MRARVREHLYIVVCIARCLAPQRVHFVTLDFFFSEQSFSLLLLILIGYWRKPASSRLKMPHKSSVMVQPVNSGLQMKIAEVCKCVPDYIPNIRKLIQNDKIKNGFKNEFNNDRISFKREKSPNAYRCLLHSKLHLFLWIRRNDWTRRAILEWRRQR